MLFRAIDRISEKQGRDTLNIDRMIRKFGFITGDEIHF